jgi:hypothetical protein
VWTVLLAAVSAVAILVTAVIAIMTLRELRADSRERTRPFVVASLERPPAMYGAVGLDLVIRNSGVTAARDLRVGFAPDPLIIDETGEQDPRDRKAAEQLVEMFSRPIGVLPAGRRLRMRYYWSQEDPEDRSRMRNAYPLPSDLTVSLSYQGQDRTPFEDEYRLAVSDVKENHGLASHSTDQLRDIQQAIANLVMKLDSMG